MAFEIYSDAPPRRSCVPGLEATGILRRRKSGKLAERSGSIAHLVQGYADGKHVCEMASESSQLSQPAPSYPRFHHNIISHATGAGHGPPDSSHRHTCLQSLHAGSRTPCREHTLMHVSGSELPPPALWRN